MAFPPAVKAYDVAVVGEIYADHVFSGFAAWPGPGEEVLATDYLRELGGGTINTACGLSRLGRRTRLIGLIGETDLAWFEHRLREFGVVATGLHLSTEGTGISVSLSTPEDRSFFTFVGANRALGELLLEPATLAELSAARHVHFAMPLERAQAKVVLSALKAAGCTTSLDVGYSPAWLNNAANWDTCLAVDFLLPNQKEAALLSGDQAPDTFAAWARSMGLGTFVVKLGGQGALIVDEQGARVIPPPRIVALDTTGAGDAFNAGFIDGWLDNLPIDSCVRRACVCGALCATAAGALAALPHSPVLRSTYEQTYGA
jgi:sugar/nucleoside kinase (ribokinase family)